MFFIFFIVIVIFKNKKLSFRSGKIITNFSEQSKDIYSLWCGLKSKDS